MSIDEINARIFEDDGRRGRTLSLQVDFISDMPSFACVVFGLIGVPSGYARRSGRSHGFVFSIMILWDIMSR